MILAVVQFLGVFYLFCDFLHFGAAKQELAGYSGEAMQNIERIDVLGGRCPKSSASEGYRETYEIVVGTTAVLQRCVKTGEAGSRCQSPKSVAGLDTGRELGRLVAAQQQGSALGFEATSFAQRFQRGFQFADLPAPS